MAEESSSTSVILQFAPFQSAVDDGLISGLNHWYKVKFLNSSIPFFVNRYDDIYLCGWHGVGDGFVRFGVCQGFEENTLISVVVTSDHAHKVFEEMPDRPVEEHRSNTDRGQSLGGKSTDSCKREIMLRFFSADCVGWMHDIAT
ncbi:uncharacterized protein LOC113315833 [Papaver somniferum]|uniref:uncharacterized protein LOC113315833 n=1 Tax=Papaver somniferum TaxID=3469 RepID=UPI000E702933|nr:uncharacterized protein LOC113315833 [Papaver somniferum]